MTPNETLRKLLQAIKDGNVEDFFDAEQQYSKVQRRLTNEEGGAFLIALEITVYLESRPERGIPPTLTEKAEKFLLETQKKTEPE